MKYLLDTDHISILQLRTGPEFVTLATEAPVLPFDATAVAIFDGLRAQRVRIATMDLRIAAIALSRGLVLLTRNSGDFLQVPGLVSEDWTR